MKTCFKCGARQPLSEFYRHAQMADGHLNKCKTCTKKDTILNRRNKVEFYRSYDRKRFRDSAVRREAQAERSREWNRKNPDGYKAHYLLTNAVRDGRIVKMPCEKCGRTDKVHGHHDDYSRPLDVIWLCPVHHSERDREIDSNQKPPTDLHRRT